MEQSLIGTVPKAGSSRYSPLHVARLFDGTKAFGVEEFDPFAVCRLQQPSIRRDLNRMEIFDRQDHCKMKGIKRAEVMLEDEVLTPPDMRTIQLKQPELCQQISRRHGEDLHQTITRKCTVLTFPIQGRSQFRDRQIGCD